MSEHHYAANYSGRAFTIIPHGHPGEAFLRRMAEELHHKFAIEHSTIQLEMDSQACMLVAHA